MIFIITGVKNEGKTRTLKLISDILINKPGKSQLLNGTNIQLDGFVCNKVFLTEKSQFSAGYDENNQNINKHHIGYNLMRVSDQRNVPFIRLSEYNKADFGEGLLHGPFLFFIKGIAEGKKILQECYVKKIKNVIIDEIGKLELEGKIFADELQELVKYFDKINLFLSVRTEFLEPVLEKFRIKTYVIIQTSYSEEKIKKILKDVS
jgi:nucleoside-triphosphatase THEP1